MSAVLEEGGPLWPQILDGMGYRSQPMFVSENLNTSQWKPHDSIFIRLRTVPERDRQTDKRADRIPVGNTHLAQCVVARKNGVSKNVGLVTTLPKCFLLNYNCSWTGE